MNNYYYENVCLIAPNKFPWQKIMTFDKKINKTTLQIP